MDLNDITQLSDAQAPLLYEDTEDPQASSALGWRIDNLASADWAMKRLGECEAEVEQIAELTRQAHQRIDKRAAELTKRAGGGIHFFRGHLLEWMERAHFEILKGKAKSRALLYGVVGWKRAPDRLVYDDEAVTLAWAKEQGVEAGLYRVTYALEKKAVKERAQRTGEAPPGAHWEPGEDKPFVDAVQPQLTGEVSP